MDLVCSAPATFQNGQASRWMGVVGPKAGCDAVAATIRHMERHGYR